MADKVHCFSTNLALIIHVSLPSLRYVYECASSAIYEFSWESLKVEIDKSRQTGTLLFKYSTINRLMPPPPLLLLLLLLLITTVATAAVFLKGSPRYCGSFQLKTVFHHIQVPFMKVFTLSLSLHVHMYINTHICVCVCIYIHTYRDRERRVTKETWGKTITYRVQKKWLGRQTWQTKIQIQKHETGMNKS